ncbi:MAG TPA: hypothetical protein ENI87_00610, partial [bacterium]|nr:hypothetical protein [bacterium]
MKIWHAAFLVFVAACVAVWFCCRVLSDRAPADAWGGDSGLIEQSLTGLQGSHGHSDMPPDPVMREQRSPLPGLVVEVLLPGQSAPAVGAIVHVAGHETGRLDEHDSLPVEQIGRYVGRTDASGRVSVSLRGVRCVSARLGAMYTERRVHAESGTVTIVMVDEFSPLVQVVDERGSPVAGVDVEVVAGRSDVVTSAE